MEVALSFQRMIDECSLKQEELGERVSKNRSTRYQLLAPAEIAANHTGLHSRWRFEHGPRPRFDRY